jgi:excisionase family DNA binding protein
MNASQTSEADRLLTVVEAAGYLNLSVGGLYHLISQHRIPVVRISSRCVRFSRAALQEWIESLSQRADEFSQSKTISTTRKQTGSVGP